MAKQKFIALYTIGAIAAGQSIELDPEGDEAKRLLKAKAIAAPEDVKRQQAAELGDTKADEQIAALEKQVAHEQGINKELDAKVNELAGVIAELQEQLKQANEAKAEQAEQRPAAEQPKAEPPKKGGK